MEKLKVRAISVRNFKLLMFIDIACIAFLATIPDAGDPAWVWGVNYGLIALLALSHWSTLGTFHKYSKCVGAIETLEQMESTVNDIDALRKQLGME